MHFDLEFLEPIQKSFLKLNDLTTPAQYFPFTEKLNYENQNIYLRHFHYNRESIQLDHYISKNKLPYEINIVADSSTYVLIALYIGEIQYNHLDSPHEKVILQQNQCRILYIRPGRFMVTLCEPLSDFYVISIAPDILYPLREEFQELIQFMDSPKHVYLDTMTNGHMDRTFHYRLKRLFNPPPTRHKDFNRLLLWELPALLSAYKGLLKGKDRESQDLKLLKEILHYIHDQIEQYNHISVRSICLYFPLSDKKLDRMFSQHLNVLPQKYIRYKRMTMVASLLKSTSLPILDIAIMCGYTDHNSLGKAFKQEMGITPREFRNQ